MLRNSSNQSRSSWDLKGLSGLFVFCLSGLPLARMFLILLEFWMIAHSSVFASDCESQGKWLSAEDLVTLFAKEIVFTRLRFTSLVDCFAARLFTRCWRFRFSCSDTSPNWVVRTVFIPAWSIFPSIYAFPPPFLFPCILEIIDLYPGRGTLIALYLVHFCFVGGVLKEKMGRSFCPSLFFGYRWEARSYISP